MKNRDSLAAFLLVLLVSATALTVDVRGSDDFFNYISPGETKAMIESGKALNLLDIQVQEEYTRHHIRGSMPTYAYPVKSDEERSMLDKVIHELEATAAMIVIICPRGGGGAKRTFQYLASRGIEEERMFILEEGQNGWPYPELMESNE